MNNVVEIDEGRRHQAREAWTRINAQSKMLREDWLIVGQYLVMLREKHQANQAFGREARATFPDIGKDEISGAQWWASLPARRRAQYSEMYPNMNNPQALRRKAYEDESDEEDTGQEPAALSYHTITPISSTDKPENAENPANSPANEPESLPEISQKTVDGNQIKKTNPLVMAKLDMEDVKTLIGFYPDSNCRMIFYAISRKGSAQKKWLASHAELIRSGKIGKENDLPVGNPKSCRNARIIHRALPNRFADQWHFGDGKIEKLNELLKDAPKLYALGEQIKGCESPSKTVEQAFKLWATMNPKSEPERPPAPPAPVIVQATVAEEPEPDATPPDQQQTIRVCGKQFWPPSEYCKMTYSQVWGVALYVKLTYMQMVHAGHESPESVIVHMMQSARALRLGNREFGSMYHNILSSMMGRVDQIEDPELTQWPTNGIGKPPEYEA